jgi:phosphate acyltransferase
VDGIFIISHGSSQAPSIFNAIRLAAEAVDHKVSDQIRGCYRQVMVAASDGER